MGWWAGWPPSGEARALGDGQVGGLPLAQFPVSSLQRAGHVVPPLLVSRGQGGGQYQTEVTVSDATEGALHHHLALSRRHHPTHCLVSAGTNSTLLTEPHATTYT